MSMPGVSQNLKKLLDAPPKTQNLARKLRTGALGEKERSRRRGCFWGRDVRFELCQMPPRIFWITGVKQRAIWTLAWGE
jgi:hypothetical protein